MLWNCKSGENAPEARPDHQVLSIAGLRRAFPAGARFAVFGVCLLQAVCRADADALTGSVRAGSTWAPLAGAKVSLAFRSEVAWTLADGSFTLPFSPSAGIAAPEGSRRTALEHGRLSVHAGTDGIRLALFNLAGKRLASRRYTEVAGWHSLDIADLLSGVNGLGWLQVETGGRKERFRILGMGSAGAGTAPVGVRPLPAPGRTALRLATEEVLDTLRVESRGYHPWIVPVTRSMLNSAMHGIDLWKNSLVDLDPGEAAAWRAHLERPVQLVRIGPYSLGLPANHTGGAIVTADGEEVERWSTRTCFPAPPPKSIWFSYLRDGQEYRDTVPLAPFLAFHDSFRTRLDTLEPNRFRTYTTWVWPEGVSVLPERDWLEVYQAQNAGDQHFLSYPDVYQVGLRYGIEGSVDYFGEFSPRTGALMMTNGETSDIGYAAQFTLARRPGHDLRVQLEWRPPVVRPARFEFLNAWPADGVLRAGESLPLQCRFQPPGDSAYLEISETRLWDTEGMLLESVWQRKWDGSRLDWKFPFPVLDTLSIWLRMRKEVYGVFLCEGLGESPELRIVPDSRDTSAGAFEPNENPALAASVEKGRWYAAAWDFRGSTKPRDVDYYRFRAAAGERLRFTARNRDAVSAVLTQDFGGPATGYSLYPGQERAIDYAFPGEGNYLFRMEGDPGYYEFRIDPVD